MSLSKYNKNKGFTILELILVITMISILSIPVSVSVFEHFRSRAVNEVVSDLSQAVENARLISFRFNVPVYMIIDANSGTLEINWDRSEVKSDNIAGFNIETYKRNIFGSEITLNQMSKNGTEVYDSCQIIFRPNGSCDYVQLLFSIGQDETLFNISPLTVSSDSSSYTHAKVIDLDKSDMVSSDIFKQ